MQTLKTLTHTLEAMANHPPHNMGDDAEVVMFCPDCRDLKETGNVSANGTLVQLTPGPTSEQRAFRNLCKMRRTLAAEEVLGYIEERVEAPVFNGLVDDYLEGEIGKAELEVEARDLPVVNFSADEATYVGDQGEGCYYQVGQGLDLKYYVTVVVDSERGAFVQDLEADTGPYDKDDQAATRGRVVAEGWCIDNDVDLDPQDDAEASRHYLLNGEEREIEIDISDFINANRDGFDPRDLYALERALRSLRPGDEYSAGGGAAAEWKVVCR